MAALPSPWRIAGDRLLLHVRVTPRAGRDAIDRVEIRDDGRAMLRVTLKAAPADGAANAALARLLADALGVPRRDVAITVGATARIKTVALPPAARGALERVVAAAPGPS